MAKFLVPLTIFLLASNANAFTNLSPVARNLVWVNHVIQFDESMSNPKNKPSIEPMCEPTNDQMVNDGINTSYTFETVNGVNAKPFETVTGMSHVHVKDIVNNRVSFRVSVMDNEIQSRKTHSQYTESYKWRFWFRLHLSGMRVLDWLIVVFICIGRQLPTCSTHSILSSLLISKEVSYLPVLSSLHSTVRLQVPEGHVGFALLW